MSLDSAGKLLDIRSARAICKRGRPEPIPKDVGVGRVAEW